jgi:hypothetical protein
MDNRAQMVELAAGAGGGWVACRAWPEASAGCLPGVSVDVRAQGARAVVARGRPAPGGRPGRGTRPEVGDGSALVPQIRAKTATRRYAGNLIKPRWLRLVP